MSETAAPAAIGRYRVTGTLGTGGMGVVYAARDAQLDRPLAVKLIRGDAASDPVSRARLWREARAAAAVSHPNICQLYEVGEADGELYLAMELLDGRSLAARLEEGPLPPGEALGVALATLGALDALHEHGLVHRDLKPSNVFLTRYGIKLLDFGLARPLWSDEEETIADLTLPGRVVGTPSYMAPEQLGGRAADARTDLFAVGVLLYEMLTGRSPFAGRSVVETMHAILYERVPALTGSPAVEAADGIIQRALEKTADDRYPSARAMADAIRAAMALSDPSGEAPVARAVTRLIVVPFRVLRPDPETDFLAVGLADAITGSLSGIDSLVVRSSLAAAAFGDTPADLRRIAAEADVDAVVTGTLLRAGNQIRVTAQLLEAPEGTVLWSDAAQSPVGDLFGLQDDFTHRIVESLSIPLTRREAQLLRRDVPATSRAYEFYLRGNRHSLRRSEWPLARDFYEQCLREDPRYAPAWARLGRVRRLIGIYVEGGRVDEYLDLAEEAFTRALALNPDLPLAHNLYAYLEVDRGRAEEAMLRLLACTRRQKADPDLYAGLVHACRYCGLLEASVAAHEKARRLDPRIRTSVAHTFWFLGDETRALENETDDMPFMRLLVRIRTGQIAEVVDDLKRLSADPDVTYARGWRVLLAVLERDTARFDAAIDTEAAAVRDPEGMYYWAVLTAFAGDAGRALALLERAVARGWMCTQAFASPWLDRVRADPRFGAIVRTAETRQRRAAARFLEADGDRILGVRGPA